MSEESCLANTCLTHDDYGDIQSHPLSNQTHLKKVINVNNVSIFTIDFIIFITRNVS